MGHSGSGVLAQAFISGLPGTGWAMPSYGWPVMVREGWARIICLHAEHTRPCLCSCTSLVATARRWRSWLDMIPVRYITSNACTFRRKELVKRGLGHGWLSLDS